MNRRLHPIALASLLMLAACSTQQVDTAGSIGELRRTRIDLSDVKIDGSTELAIQSYQKFLEQTPEQKMTPEAIRRLADLKIKKEYGTAEGVKRNTEKAAQREAAAAVALAAPAAATAPAELPKPATGKLAAPKVASPQLAAADSKKTKKGGKGGKAGAKESDTAFEARATKAAAIQSQPQAAIAAPDGSAVELQGEAGEAIALYEKLLAKYPHYERNDQVLYQLSRAYDESAMTEKAMGVMNRIVKQYPGSRYFDEVQFRIGEYHFTRKKWLDAEDAYKSIAEMGPASSYYELSLYKLGWTFYKQDMYEDALKRFTGLLDHKIKTGYDFEKPKDPLEHQRIEDTYGVISMAFSNMGGADAVDAYFGKIGKRSYEVNVYGNLAEHYLDKLRYQDAAVTYKAFVKREPFHKVAPLYDTRVIDIYKRGGFPKLVIDSNKEFVVNYGLKSAYWQHNDITQAPQVIGYVKTALKDLANHYHSLYQDKRLEKDKPQNFAEAMRWYRDYLTSFPKEAESPGINHQLAELLLENGNYAEAAVEFEHTAYDYPAHAKSADAGYAAVYSYRKNLDAAPADQKDPAKKEAIRSSLKFAQTFTQHEKAALVMIAAIDDIYDMKNYELAVDSSRKFIALFPNAELAQRRTAWVTLAHSSFELGRFRDAEEAYIASLPLVPETDKSRTNLIENLAASIYKQGEAAGKGGDHKQAAYHFLRVAKAAPTSSIRPNAEFDGAAALMELKDWDGATSVLQAFRASFPNHKLQPEVTKKMAYAYREAGKPALAAAEYERIYAEQKDPETKAAALQVAGDLYVEAKELDKAVAVYRRYIAAYPKPFDVALENRYKIANILKDRADVKTWHAELRGIVAADAAAGKDRTDRTKYLAASSLLTLTEPSFTEYTQVKLVAPFDKNLAKKKAALKTVKEGMEAILKYQIGETSAAASYYLAEMYFEFNRALITSERPANLDGDEKEQYELALEEQAEPFENQAIKIHQKNTDFVTLGLYNDWVKKSFDKLAKLVPARYAKFEETSGFVSSFDQKVAYGKLTMKPEVVVAQAAPGAVGAPGAAASKAPDAAAADAGQPAAAPAPAEEPKAVPPPAQAPAAQPPAAKSATAPVAARKTTATKRQTPAKARQGAGK